MGSFFSSSKLLFSIITILLLCFVSSVTSQPDFLYHFCINNGNYTNSSTYETNLNKVLSSTKSNTEIDYGFYNMSSSQGPDSAHAIALCRGDVTQADCRKCLNESTHKLTQICPNYKQAIGWYDYCMLRYTNNSNIFGTSATSPAFYMWNTQNVTNQTQFDTALGVLLNDLRIEASNGDSRSKFGTGNVSLTSFQNIYGLAQCTPDLSRRSCSNCLGECIGQVPKGQIGGRYITPSCNVRFETYEFYDPKVDNAPPPSTSIAPPTTTSTRPNITGSNSNNTSRVIIIVVVSVVTFVVLIVCICIFLRLRKRNKVERGADNMITAESLQIDFATIKAATNDFSDDNKLGHGGYGAVYKGRLLDGQEIAVKRLSKGSGQGDKEFKTEVMLVAKLQHRNLVRLLGFSLEGDERLLVYEFVPNASLDHFLFDTSKRSMLDWETRYKIIGGIVRGLLYLHEDSRLRIIHRDLKASNILLDEEMTPKIADFGLAKLFVVDQTQGDTSQIVGTYGYMAPEYAMRGHFSVKSDVYSFGVLLLEIISGQKNSCFKYGEHMEDLISYAWESWRDGTISNLVDPTIRGGSNSEIMRCIHIGLLCVQEMVSERPTMASIAMMLSSNSITLPVPSQRTLSFLPKIAENDSSVGSDKSQNNNVGGFSANDVSITELYPR